MSLLVAMIQTTGEKVLAADKGDHPVSPASNEVVITPVAVKVPLGRILLVRKDSDYCAVKFTEFWTGKTELDWYANYESYYQNDKTGDFSNKNVQLKKDELSFPKPRGIGRLAFSFGNKDVRCGPIKLFWFGEGWVCAYSSGQKQGDYGIELAPTKWTDISQVNVFDSRLTWYRYDEKRKDITIPIDKLWGNNANATEKEENLK